MAVFQKDYQKHLNSGICPASILHHCCSFIFTFGSFFVSDSLSTIDYIEIQHTTDNGVSTACILLPHLS